MTDDFLQGIVHEAADDMQAAIRADAGIFALWQGLTPLGRNEFICWVEDAKQAATRARRIARTVEELQEGKKRPCCWAGTSPALATWTGPWPTCWRWALRRRCSRAGT